ncbi:MAG TPA: TonB-dependent receptor [Caulobacteraceae bacterium]
MMFGKFSRLGLETSAAAAALLVFAMPVAAVAQSQATQFNIPAQTLGSALRAYGQATGQPIIFSEDDVRGKRTTGVVGSFAPDEALRRLLAGSGLEVKRTAGGVIYLGAAAQDAAPAAEAATSVQEVVVTGTNIRGIAPAGSPIETFSRKQIDDSGLATLDQFFTTIPQNLAQYTPVTNLNGNSVGGPSQSGSNNYAGAFANIHGLGPDATLTLINGARIAPAGDTGSLVDISLIPLAAVDHVEILADGASAIYGTDAVAGVVNIVLRHDFDGAESSVRYGGATEGGDDELTASQLLGKTWSTGNVLLVYEYDHQYGLTAAQRSFSSGIAPTDTILPTQLRQSVFVTGSQQLPADISLDFSAFYTTRQFADTFVIPAFASFNTTGTSDQYGGNLSLSRKLFGDWTGTFVADSSRTDQNRDLVEFGTPNLTHAVLGVDSVGVRADGSLFPIWGGDVKAAVGGEVRRESIDQSQIDAANPGTDSLHRTVTGLYGELFVPLVGADNGVPLVKSLSASIAGRYDDYENSGSSFNPKVGLSWALNSSLTLRSSYSTSYRAPSLTELVPSPESFTYNLPNASSPSGVTDTLVNEQGGNPNLRPERATSYSAGFDLTPDFAPGLKISATYFHTLFKDRIQDPPIVGSFFDVYSQLSTLAPYFQFNPSASEVASFFNGPGFAGDYAGGGQGGVQAIFNNIPTNIAASTMSGIDALLSYRWTNDLGEFAVTGNAAYLLSNEYQPAVTTPTVSLLNLYGEPLRLRARGSIGWIRAGFNSSLSINYANSYDNPLTTPESRVSSLTTFDLREAYRFSEGSPPLLKGLAVALSVQDLFDQKPPRIVVDTGLTNPGFDPANANPAGRVISLQLTKQW